MRLVERLCRFLLRNLPCSGARCCIDADERLIWCLREQMRHDFWGTEWSGWPLSVLMIRGQSHVIQFRLGPCRQWQGFLKSSRSRSRTPKIISTTLEHNPYSMGTTNAVDRREDNKVPNCFGKNEESYLGGKKPAMSISLSIAGFFLSASDSGRLE